MNARSKMNNPAQGMPLLRRSVAVLLTLILAVSLCPLAAFADDAVPPPTSDGDIYPPPTSDGGINPPPGTSDGGIDTPLPTLVTVVFDANKGKIGSASTKTRSILSGEEYGTLPTPKRNRHAFLGWFTNKTGGTKIKASSLVAAPSDGASSYSVYAHWEKLTECTVLFDNNYLGAKTDKREVRYDSSVGKLPVPTRSRYSFMGWYTKARGGSWVSSSTKVTTQESTQRYYARWAPVHYFQGDGRWAGRRYYSTIAGSGCGPSAMAMAVYALGRNSGGVTPVTAANYSMAHGYVTSAPGRTKDGFFKSFGQQYGLSVTQLNAGDLRGKSRDARDRLHAKARNAVKEGNWVLCFMAPGNWTHVGHFVLWYDIDGDRALVRDPNAYKEAKTRAKTSLLQSQVKRYWIIKVPDSKKVFRVED